MWMPHMSTILQFLFKGNLFIAFLCVTDTAKTMGFLHPSSSDMQKHSLVQASHVLVLEQFCW